MKGAAPASAGRRLDPPNAAIEQFRKARRPPLTADEKAAFVWRRGRVHASIRGHRPASAGHHRSASLDATHHKMEVEAKKYKTLRIVMDASRANAGRYLTLIAKVQLPLQSRSREDLIMYLFIRSARIGNAACMPAAVQFAAEVAAYLNKRYGLNMKLGVGALDQPVIQWQFELDSSDELAALNDKLGVDPEYSALVEKYKDAWFAKSMNDTLVNVAR